MEVVANSYEGLMAGTRIGKKEKERELVGLEFHIDETENYSRACLFLIFGTPGHCKNGGGP